MVQQKARSEIIEDLLQQPKDPFWMKSRVVKLRDDFDALFWKISRTSSTLGGFFSFSVERYQVLLSFFILNPQDINVSYTMAFA
ncbi:hypothetical protein O6P43_032065 [Quillaja saponaria]|uniref:Uncharacterized protein n=1 Tax=Quillaja saponaria TaxID=32244 RepID=A0AAD7KWA4_QUISA|nr:hypothetical protein O6P43_032065 [Quillaja saponaria]